MEIGDESPEDDDAVCIICESRFSESKRAELCLICEMWAHNDCPGCGKDNYVCDFGRQPKL
ncbi:unnamed protein product [Acanthoscelides obtectus]|uniref:Uncharacterized protein n=1 Tax=Acanthoscelides obtectus TaxID=200917 RepID=A0A9P0K9Y1_ACAOB|nr:unnamed protein product [Acanthoscelides obtectus]CAK1662297.1 hypothetical protein AOBTE_LOCUS23074 [Acanthoscelides obtectus]